MEIPKVISFRLDKRNLIVVILLLIQILVIDKSIHSFCIKIGAHFFPYLNPTFSELMSADINRISKIGKKIGGLLRDLNPGPLAP